MYIAAINQNLILYIHSMVSALSSPWLGTVAVDLHSELLVAQTRNENKKKTKHKNN